MQMRLTRRQFIRGTALLGMSAPIAAMVRGSQAPLVSFEGDQTFERILFKARQGGWATLPIGERMGRISMELLDTPYVGHTIELDDSKEYCVIDLKGLDCVTFFEDTLGIARILRHPNPSKQDFLDQVRFTRYRGGVQGDFTTRLHYTSEWIHDNVSKGVVADLTPSLPGARPFTQRVGYMSQHPEAYRQLNANHSLLPAIRAMERHVNGLKMSYLPLERIAEAEPLLRTGDIVGVTTTESGIDVAHTGLCYRDPSGMVHFMDASSSPKRMKVTLEGRLSESLHWSHRLTGIMIARPLEISGTLGQL